MQRHLQAGHTTQADNTKIYPYGIDDELPILGELSAPVLCNERGTEPIFYVTKASRVSLLSYETAKTLGLINITLSAVTSDAANMRMVSDDLIDQNSELLTGIGKLTNQQVKLHIDDSVPVVTQPPRSVPFHLRKKVAPT